MKLHKYCKLFPEITGEDFRKLTQDISENGLRQPITLMDGAILDGQNRYNACIAAKVKPIYADYAGDDPLGFVISQNMARRHLTDDQRAIIAGEIAKAKSGKPSKLNGFESPTIAQAADALKVSPEKVKKGKRLARESKSLSNKVKKGEMTLNAATEQLHPRKTKVAEPPEASPTEADIDAFTSAAPENKIALDAAKEVVEKLWNEPEPAPELKTVDQAVAYCMTHTQDTGPWPTIAMILTPEIDRLTDELTRAKANLEKVIQAGTGAAAYAGTISPKQLLDELKKFKPLIPDSLPQADRMKYGEVINRMVVWLMNPVENPNLSAYTR